MICSLFVDKVNKETYLCAMKQEYISRIRSFNRYLWGIERSGFFNGREKWAKGFENQRV